MLDSSTTVVINILLNRNLSLIDLNIQDSEDILLDLNLRLLLAWSWFIQWHLDRLFIVCHHNRPGHSCIILSNVLIVDIDIKGSGI